MAPRIGAVREGVPELVAHATPSFGGLREGEGKIVCMSFTISKKNREKRSTLRNISKYLKMWNTSKLESVIADVS